MKKYLLITITLLLYSSRVISQNDYGKVWVNGAPISYKTIFNSNNLINQFYDSINTFLFSNSNSDICDVNGNLILASTSCDLFDANAQLIQNGDTLVPSVIYQAYDGSIPYSQASIILPVSATKYYFITPTVSDSEYNANWNGSSGRILFDMMYCHTIDMSANNGLGAVVRKKQVLLEHAELGTTRMTACRHGDGNSWWLLKQGYDSNIVYKFIFTKDTIYGPYIQRFAQPYFTKFDYTGQSSFSKDGTLYATSNTKAQKVFVANFDRCSGNLFNPRVIDVPNPWSNNPFDSTELDIFISGVTFSPNGRFLYIVKQFNIMQFDIQDTNPNTQWCHVGGLDTTWAAFQYYCLAYPGPDNKLYIGNWNGFSPAMSVINNPDVKGAGCNFCPKCLRFPHHPPYTGGYVTTPPNMPNYKLGATNPPCVVGVPEVGQGKKLEFSVSPNPFEQTLIIKTNFAQQETFYLYDVIGKLILTKTIEANKEQINTANLAAGLYFYSIVNKNGERVKAGKMVKE